MADLSRGRVTAIHVSTLPPKNYEFKYENYGDFTEGVTVG